jgi:molybdate transport system substrate-binding protein
MRSIILSLLLITLLTVGCTPQVPEPAPAKNPPRRTLTVMAAASLTESFTELGRLFESQNPGVTVVFNFAGSQQLFQQLEQGADADVFASANKKYMDAAIAAKRVAQQDARPFVTNRLVVIFPKDNPAGLVELNDLAKPGIKLVLADKSVPVGQYSLEFLDKAVVDRVNYDAAFKDAVLANVVSYENNVKAVVTKVALGEADAGIVYLTDYNSQADKLDKLDIPDPLNSIATYPIAAITDSKNADLAAAFVEFVLSSEGQAALAKYGFVPAANDG